MPAQTYRLPNFLGLLPRKPGGEISPHFKDADDGYHSWVHDKIGWLFAIVGICCLRFFCCLSLTPAARRFIMPKCLY